MEWFIDVFRKSFIVQGRASRKQFWMFSGVVVLIFGVLVILDEILAFSGNLAIMSNIFSWLILIPSLSLWGRRLQDVNKPWTFVFIPFYNLVLAFQKGDEGMNYYGKPPIDIFSEKQDDLLDENL